MESVPVGHDERREAVRLNPPWRASAEASETVDVPDAVSVEVDAAFDLTTPLVEIGMFEKQGQLMDRLVRTMIVTKRYSDFEDGAGVAALLASSESGFATGPLFMTDNGMAMQ